MSTRRFVVTEDHLKLMRRMIVNWQDAEYGAPEINPKRPYGNSDAAYDIAKILGWTYNEDDGLSHQQEEAAFRIHRETVEALEIALRTGHFEAGAYLCDEYSRNWRLVL